MDPVLRRFLKKALDKKRRTFYSIINRPTVGSQKGCEKMSERIDPKQRKMEYLETALELFNEKGYEKTTIKDIINAMGVSKGAFYHYFQSKEDIIEEISDAYAERMLRQTQELVNRQGLSPTEKINELFKMVQGYKKSHSEKRQKIKNIFQEDQNLKLQRRIMTKLRNQMMNSVLKMIEDGVKAGEFRNQDIYETTDYLLYVIQGLNRSIEEIVTMEFKKEAPDLNAAEEKMRKKLKFYEKMFELTLGTEEGAIQITEVYLDRFLER